MMFAMIFTLGLVCFIFLLMIVIFSWVMGSKFDIKGNKGRRLNPFERFFDGFTTLMM